jgi:phage repressor protein C with HTH and peptisase S24 domain
MSPEYVSGNIVVCAKYFKPKVDDVVIVKTANEGVIIKRIENISNGEITVIGDNKRLSSSLCDVPYAKDNLVGKVLYRFNWFME